MSQAAYARAMDKFLIPQPTDELNSNVSGVANVVDFPASREKSLHKTVGLLALTGQSCAQIAEVLQLKVTQIELIYSSPEVLALFKREMDARGKYVVKKLLQGAAIDAIITVQELAKDVPADNALAINAARVKLSACREILDRAYGKPTQKVSLDDDLGEGDPEAELLRVKGQIEELQKNRKTMIS